MGILDDVGRIERIFYSPCSPTPEMWVKAAVPAALTLIKSLLPTDWKSEVKLATGKSWLKNLKGILSASELELPVAVDGAFETLFVIAEVADAAAWFFFLASIGVEFLADWSTIAMRADKCLDSRRPDTICGNLGEATASTPGFWFEGPKWKQTAPASEKGNVLASAITIPAGQTGTISAYWRAVDVEGNACGFETRVINTQTDEVVATGSISNILANEGLAMIIHTMIVAQPDVDTLFELQWTPYGPQPITFVNGSGSITMTRYSDGYL